MGKTGTCPPLKNIQGYIRFNYNILASRKEPKSSAQATYHRVKKTQLVEHSAPLDPQLCLRDPLHSREERTEWTGQEERGGEEKSGDTGEWIETKGRSYICEGPFNSAAAITACRPKTTS